MLDVARQFRSRLWGVAVVGAMAPAALLADPPAPARVPIPAEPGQQTVDASQKPQVDAAVSVAVEKLSQKIVREPLGQGGTVGDFLQRTRGWETFTQTLQSAELVGGARWLDEHTVQVQLEIAGPRVAKVLEQLAASEPKRSPVTPDELAKSLASWKDRTFFASGACTSGASLASLRPHRGNDAWSSVKDADRQQALASARSDAVDHVLQSVRSVRLGKDATVADVLANKEIDSRFEAWLSARPISHVDFRPDLSVEMTLAVSPGEALRALRSAIKESKEQVVVSLPETDRAWRVVRSDFEERMLSPTGHAALDPTATARATPGVALPDAAPRWVQSNLREQASATGKRSKLLLARQAEADARKKLREQIESLALSKDLTVGQAAQRDPRFKNVVDQAVATARVQTDYSDPKAGVVVNVALDGQELWDQLKESP